MWWWSYCMLRVLSLLTAQDRLIVHRRQGSIGFPSQASSFLFSGFFSTNDVFLFHSLFEFRLLKFDSEGASTWTFEFRVSTVSNVDFSKRSRGQQKAGVAKGEVNPAASRCPAERRGLWANSLALYALPVFGGCQKLNQTPTRYAISSSR